MTTFWIFKDVEKGEPRITSTDPGPLLSQLPQPPVEAPLAVADGVLLATVLGQMNALLTAMRGLQGNEAYVRVTITGS